jgi:hypothetical protein
MMSRSIHTLPFLAGIFLITSSFATSNDTSGPRDFYIAPNGDDANAGTAAAPWLTPNHAVRCGDTVHLAPGTYTQAFDGNWGQVWSCRLQRACTLPRWSATALT